MSALDITMYGADWCGDCLRAKAWFAANNVGYRFVDLVEDEGAVDSVLAHIRSVDADGRQRIPVIVFGDGSHLVEPSDDDLSAKLAELGEAGFRVADNPDEGRYELWRDGELLSIATYQARSGMLVVPHVETNPAHRGQGNAARLLEGVLAQLRADGRHIVPLCPFAADHIAEHPRLHDLLAPR